MAWLHYNLNATYTDSRYIVLFGGASKTIEDVLEFGASVRVTVSRWLTLTLTGEDLTNQKRPDQFGFTATDRDYPTPGRRFRLTAAVAAL
ncbi:MAG: TonB-dependent receptor [Candidatus Zixiibacteriota bacterium]|nr:MAG: TonB-dependent receptor [candidate division Zixibacteria bacterium]